MKKILLLFSLLFLTNCLLISQIRVKYTKYVDPFLGTGGHGHVYPGATLPFGMVQLSPDTKTTDWDWCSGYHYPDSSIMGFSHLHLSGTGASDLGDIMFMPTVGKLMYFPGEVENPGTGYRSLFKHKNETASPGYYSVFLDDPKVKVELTTTLRTGFHKYTYPKGNQSNIIIDLTHGIHDEQKISYIKINNKREIEGYRTSNGWAKEHTVYFVARFSKDISSYKIFDGTSESDKIREFKGKIVKAGIVFETSEGESVLIKVGISHTGIPGAKKNLDKENRTWDFDLVRKKAEQLWEKELRKIEVSDENEVNKTKFYTSLYRVFLSPNIFSDVDGCYRGMDKQICKSNGFNMYTVFSLWDTFRALHPLLTIIDKKRTLEFVKSLIAKSNEYGVFPMWELVSEETGCMIGYHAIPVITDAWMKGVKNFNVNEALSGMLKTSSQFKLGIPYQMDLGYVPMDKEVDAVSKTLEYSYDDWCISRFAGGIKNKINSEYYRMRSLNYINVFDSQTGFMRGRNSDGTWKKNFDPLEPFPLGVGEFTEGNAWQYLWFVPHNIPNLIELIGGKEKFSKKLDEFFTIKTDKYHNPSDMTGLIGQYAHGNEPSHHITYLYDYCDQPYKTQEKTRLILENLYKTGRDGLSGNDDCGQMSAWFVFSALGFYPVTPGSTGYALTSPLFEKTKINLENGKTFEIMADSNSATNIYINFAKLNNNKYNKAFINHSDIHAGKKLYFAMSASPNINWGKDHSGIDIPKISLKGFKKSEERKLFPPYFKTESTIFSDQKSVKIGCFSKGAKIFYTTDGTTPDSSSLLYKEGFNIDQTTTINAISLDSKSNISERVFETFYKAIYKTSQDSMSYPSYNLKYSPHRRYSGNGSFGLMNGRRAAKSYLDKEWCGWQNNNLDIVIDLGKEIKLKGITVGFLKNQGSWIFLPSKIQYEISIDGKNYNYLGDMQNELKKDDNVEIVNFRTGYNNTRLRYLRVVAQNIGKIPEWHYGRGGEAFIFCDEIIIEPGN